MGLVLLVELLSYLGWFFPVIGQIVFVVIILLAFLGTLYRLEYGLFVVMVELIIGSKGQLFMITLGSTVISLRLGLFLVVFLAWLVTVWRRRSSKLLQLPYRAWLIALIVLLLAAGIHGIVRGYPTTHVFLDGNGYLYLGLFGLFVDGLASGRIFNQVWQVFLAGTNMVAIKTLVLLGFFSHQSPILRSLYRWVRDTRVNEITQQPDSVFVRVFTQSHIYSLLATVILIVLLFSLRRLGQSRRHRFYYWGSLVLSSTALLVSFSRSMWLGLVLTLPVALIILKRRLDASWKTTAQWLGRLFLVAVIDLGLMLAVLYVPIGQTGPGGRLNALASRVTEVSGETGAQSRKELLPPLVKRIAERPLTGSGFGTPVTYQTLDPRIVQATGGSYTTYGFEWGYLDQLSEFGILGLAVYLGLLVMILRTLQVVARTGTNPEQRALAGAVFFGLLALMLTHTTTPYLGHPLGLGFVMLAAAAGHFWMTHSTSDDA